jgi:hypothetical protein
VQETERKGESPESNRAGNIRATALAWFAVSLNSTGLSRNSQQLYELKKLYIEQAFPYNGRISEIPLSSNIPSERGHGTECRQSDRIRSRGFLKNAALAGALSS